MEKIPFSPPLDTQLSIVPGKWAVILTHGERTDITNKLFSSLKQALNKYGISTLYFRFPFKMKQQKQQDNAKVLENSFLAAWEYAKIQLSEKNLVLAGHDIGASIAIRTSIAVSIEGEVPPVLALSYPMFPPNQPEKMDITDFYGILGSILFITGDRGNQGTHERILSQILMVANFAETAIIRNANHQFEIKGISPSIVSRWIASSIYKFLLSC